MLITERLEECQRFFAALLGAEPDPGRIGRDNLRS